MNVGSGEILVILLVALIVLGPTKLPDAARQVGKVMNELRRLSSGFQRELKEAMDDGTTERDARERGKAHIAPSDATAAMVTDDVTEKPVSPGGPGDYDAAPTESATESGDVSDPPGPPIVEAGSRVTDPPVTE